MKSRLALERLHAYGLSCALLGLVLFPAFREPPRDSFPHSDYPMFSVRRPTVTHVRHALGVHEDGSRVPLSPLIASGNREVLQSGSTISRAIRQGGAASEALCKSIVRRIEESDDPELESVVAVELVTSRFDTVRYFEESTEPLLRLVHIRCEVDTR